MSRLRYIIGSLLFLLPITTLSAQHIREDVRKAKEIYRQKQYANAEVVYRKALAQDSTFTEARFGLADAQYAQGRVDEALQNYSALAENPSLTPIRRAELMHNIGNAFMKKKDYQKSVEAYKNALRINPMDDETRYNLALAMKLLKDQQKNGGGGDDNKDQNKDPNKDNKNQQQNKSDNNNQNGKPQQSKQDNTQQQQSNKQQEMSRESAEKILKAYEQDEQKTRKKVEQMRKQQVRRSGNDSTKRW